MKGIALSDQASALSRLVAQAEGDEAAAFADQATQLVRRSCAVADWVTAHEVAALMVGRVGELSPQRFEFALAIVEAELGLGHFNSARRYVEHLVVDLR